MYRSVVALFTCLAPAADECICPAARGNRVCTVNVHDCNGACVAVIGDATLFTN